MEAWLGTVQRASNRAPSPVTFYFRDDDAGWCDQRLVEMLDRFAAYDIPIDLAVIPEALQSSLAQHLVQCVEGKRQAIAMHQHGLGHINHQSCGRKCEFGDARSPQQQKHDIVQGWRHLTDLLGDHVDTIFSPPWNRCTQDTADTLSALGFAALSRDSTATTLELNGIEEIPVHIDWLRKREGGQIPREMLGSQIAERISQAGPIGVMLHHEQTGRDELDAVEELLVLLSEHRSADFRHMKELLPKGGAMKPKECT